MGGFFGFPFHSEKSAEAGLEILHRFLHICPRRLVFGASASSQVGHAMRKKTIIFGCSGDAVLGAGAVVIRDIPANSIAVGIPAESGEPVNVANNVRNLAVARA
jgi:hypothetical protein